MVESEKMIPKTYMLNRNNIAIIQAYAKEGGYPSSSSTLRRIIFEWELFKSFQTNKSEGGLEIPK
jgi:hypothetical protein